MRLHTLGAALLLAATTAFAAPPTDSHELALRLLRKLHDTPTAPSPQAQQASGTSLQCVTLTRRDMHGLRYPGHAFLCEDTGSGEVLGAVLSTRGRVICDLSGTATGTDCWDLTICDNPDSLCLQ